jgi:hypothetical protein
MLPFLYSQVIIPTAWESNISRMAYLARLQDPLANFRGLLLQRYCNHYTT